MTSSIKDDMIFCLQHMFPQGMHLAVTNKENKVFWLHLTD